jgi:hypothetical protein
MCSTRIDRKQDEFASVTNLTNPMTIFFLHLLVESGRVTTSMPLRVPIQKKGQAPRRTPDTPKRLQIQGISQRRQVHRSGKKWVKIIHTWDSPPISFSFPLLSPVHKIELLPVPCILSDCCFRFHSSWGKKWKRHFLMLTTAACARPLESISPELRRRLLHPPDGGPHDALHQLRHEQVRGAAAPGAHAHARHVPLHLGADQVLHR